MVDTFNATSLEAVHFSVTRHVSVSSWLTEP